MNPVLKRVLTGLTIGAAVICTVLFAPMSVIAPLVAVLALLAIVEFALLLKMKCPRSTGWTGLGFLFGAALIGGGLIMLPMIAGLYGDAPCGSLRLGNVMLLYVIAVVKFSDVGGFAFGLTSAKLMKGGNHKMCPTVSPNKSWEGMFGSILFSSIVAFAFTGVTHFAWWQSLACGFTGAVVGTAGDLVESKFKRWVGVKDSSTMKITNGMGGFLDMFDSLLFAPAVLTVLFELFK